ncbi:MAG: hypothetical protein KKE86_06130 [Planctomycetes bacterium]|nr:hypothetical protein [Planctomycetota bacterium]MBU4398899.1 hypothetical protein [Planctomycetota bacterium]MCG2682201.1 hypothetical protein [Planctomycetales bacterium]
MAADPHTSPSSGFAALAKRISVWTTKGLLSAMVLVAGVGFGRQVLIWWGNDDVPTTRLLTAESLGDPRQPHSIRFGDAAWSLRRRSIVGDRSEAVAQLRAECRELLRNIKPQPSVAQQGWGGSSTATPTSSSTATPTSGATDGRGFMAHLSDSTPVDREPGKWRLYEFRETFPMAVGVAREGDRSDLPRSGPKGASHKSDLSPSADLAQLGYRAIMWAIAVPTGAKQWTLCVFRPSDSPMGEESGLVEVPIPPGCRRTLSMQAVGGGGIVAFGGPDRPDRWKRFHDDWFARQGWRPTVPWRQTGNAWYAKYNAPDDIGGAVEVRFGPDGRGGLSGLLMITPHESR